MPRQENIQNSYWDDPEIEVLSKEATVLYLWSWTNRHCNMAGLYRVSVTSMSTSKLNEREIIAALEELAHYDFVYYEGLVLWCRSRVKRLNSKSPRMAKSVAKDVAEIRAEHPLRRAFLERYASAAWLREDLRPLVPDDLDISQGPSRGPQLTLGADLALTNGSFEGHQTFPADARQGQGSFSDDQGEEASSTAKRQRKTAAPKPSGRARAPSAGELVALRVDGEPVSAEHLELAKEILAAYNEIAGQNKTAKEWIEMIVMRIREKPELTIEQHRSAIEAIHGEAWWRKGGRHFSPELVYRRGDLFEKALTAAFDPPPPPPAGGSDRATRNARRAALIMEETR